MLGANSITEERLCVDAGDSIGSGANSMCTPESLPLLEARSYRPFKSSEAYLEAMKEDLAYWLNSLYQELNITLPLFFDKLETGVVLCRHANKVRRFAQEYQLNSNLAQRRRSSHLVVPQRDLSYREDAKPQTFFARDNVHNFICWCKELGVHEVLLFETEDLILRKNEKNVILCLLEVARLGAGFGMPAPLLVQFEQEIDRDMALEDHVDCGVDGVISVTVTDKSGSDSGVGSAASSDVATPPASPTLPGETTKNGPSVEDRRSLDEIVQAMVKRCSCPSEFPMIKIAQGKYRIGDTKIIVYVRILRKHVMVRVGGGWDTLDHYLDKHDPCRCKSGHRATKTSRVVITQGATPQMEVQYERVPQDETDGGSPVRQQPMQNRNRSRSHSPAVIQQPPTQVQKENRPLSGSSFVSSSGSLSSLQGAGSAHPSEDGSSEVSSDEGYRSSGHVVSIPELPDTLKLLQPAQILLEEPIDMSSGPSSLPIELPKRTKVQVASRKNSLTPAPKMSRSRSIGVDTGISQLSRDLSTRHSYRGTRSSAAKVQTPQTTSSRGTWSGRGRSQQRPALPRDFVGEPITKPKARSLSGTPRSTSPTGGHSDVLESILMQLRVAAKPRRDSHSSATRIPAPISTRNGVARLF